MDKIKAHRTHVPAKSYRHKAKGTDKQVRQIAKRLGIKYVM